MVILRSKEVCALVLSVIVLADISIVLDIPFFRQVFGFVLLMILPGFLLTQIARPAGNAAEKLLFLIGLSVSFLMFVPWLMDVMYPQVGIFNPISLLPLLTTFSLILVGLSFVAYRTGALDFQATTCGFEMLADRIKNPSVLGMMLILVLAILGGLLIRLDLNSLFSLLLMAGVAVVVMFLIISRRVSPRFYPLWIFVIALALQYSVAMASPYLFGSDSNYELYFANLVRSSGYWNPSYVTLDYAHADYPTMLSVSLLPNTFSVLLNADNVSVFKIVYPFIFAFVPVGLYQLYKAQLNFSDKSACLSGFFFISFFAFSSFWPRQMVALLFAVLVITLVTREYALESKTSTLLLVLFMGSLVVSHYTTAYIVLFYLVVLLIASGLATAKNKQRQSRSTVNASIVILAFFMAAAWYMFVSGGAALSKLANVGNYTTAAFAREFSFNSDPTVIAGLGGGLSNLSLTHVLAHYWVLGTEVLIVVGLALVVWRRKELKVSMPFLVVSLASFLILLLSIALPTLTDAVGAARIYFLASLFLAPYCVFAIESVANVIAHRSSNKDGALTLKYAALIGVLIPYFLFNSGFIFEATENPSNFAFVPSPEQSTRPLAYNELTSWSYFVQMPIAAQGVYGSTWLAKTMGHSPVYTGQLNSELVAYGRIPPESVIWMTPWNVPNPLVNAYVYLGPANVQHGTIGVLSGSNIVPEKLSSHPALIAGDKVYSNGLVEVYRSSR
ncbi:MAG: DUF2206 domain-containing protein [Halobacteriota archaeon]